MRSLRGGKDDGITRTMGLCPFRVPCYPWASGSHLWVNSNLTLEGSLCLQGRPLPWDAPWRGRGREQEEAMGEALEMVPVGRGGRGQVGPVEASCWGCNPSSAEPLTTLSPFLPRKV